MALVSIKIEKVTDSNYYYNVYVGKGKEEVMFEILKTRFRGKKRPKAGDSFRLVQEKLEGKTVTSIYINGQLL